LLPTKNMQEIYSSLKPASALSVQQVTSFSTGKYDNEIEIRHKEMRDARAVAGFGQEKSSKIMLEKNIREIEKVKIGDRVLLRVPDVDRGPLDPNNIVCLVLEEKHSLFKLGCQVGVLDKYYAYNSFFKTRLELESSFKEDEIPRILDKKGNKTSAYVTLGLREAVSKLSVGTGQGYVKCACTNNAKCSTMRCSCRKANISCSSKCHGKSPESNCVNTDDYWKSQNLGENQNSEDKNLDEELNLEKDKNLEEDKCLEEAKIKKKTKRNRK